MAATMATAGQSISTLFISCIYVGSCISSCGSALDPKNRRPTTNSNTPKEGLLLARLHSNRKGWWMVLWSRAVVYAEANINSICLRGGFTKRGTREESSQSPLCNQLPIRFFFYLFPSNSLTFFFRFRGADRRTDIRGGQLICICVLHAALSIHTHPVLASALWYWQQKRRNSIKTGFSWNWTPIYLISLSDIYGDILARPESCHGCLPSCPVPDTDPELIRIYRCIYGMLICFAQHKDDPTNRFPHSGVQL